MGHNEVVNWLTQDWSQKDPYVAIPQKLMGGLEKPLKV